MFNQMADSVRAARAAGVKSFFVCLWGSKDAQKEYIEGKGAEDLFDGLTRDQVVDLGFNATPTYALIEDGTVKASGVVGEKDNQWRFVLR
jgi:hypothetical protein